MKHYAIIPAAGKGERFGGKKLDVLLRGKSLLDRVQTCLNETGLFSRIVVVGKDLPGGKTRAESVRNGFQSLEWSDGDIVLIHDAARPLVSVELIQKIARIALEKGAVIPVMPISDTVKEIHEGFVLKTLDRDRLFSVQTPQGFRAEFLARAYKELPWQDRRWTDESSLVEALGVPIHAVEGERENIKITTPFDLKVAEAIL